MPRRLKGEAAQRHQTHQDALHQARLRWNDPEAVRARTRARKQLRDDIEASRKATL